MWWTDVDHPSDFSPPFPTVSVTDRVLSCGESTGTLHIHRTWNETGGNRCRDLCRPQFTRFIGRSFTFTFPREYLQDTTIVTTSYDRIVFVLGPKREIVNETVSSEVQVTSTILKSYLCFLPTISCNMPYTDRITFILR